MRRWSTVLVLLCLCLVAAPSAYSDYPPYNEEQYRLLTEEGVETWNEWREKNKDVVVNLREADLAGTDLREAHLGGANLREAWLGSADLREADLDRADLQRADLGGANLQGAYLFAANLREASLFAANLRGAWLGGADLQRVDLSNTNLREAYLGGADLRETWLIGTDLQEADLVGADLTDVEFRDAKNLAHVKLYRAILEETQLYKEQLVGMIGEERDEEWLKARETYLALKKNWEQTGRYEDAAWAYRKERRMEKRWLWQETYIAFEERNWKYAVGYLTITATDQLQEVVCGYGESPSRVLITMYIVILLFTLYYRSSGAIITSEAGTYAITRSLNDCLIYSLAAFTVNTFSKFRPRNDNARLVTILESLLGIFLLGLLGFVVGNVIRRG